MEVITKDQTHSTSNIAIVGGGLVGSLAALYFAKKGHDVEVFEYREDIRETQLAVGRSINLALSERGRRALREVGLEDVVLQTAIPMRGRMLHDVKGKKTVVLYDPCNLQCLYSVGRKQLNEVLLNAGSKYANLKYHFKTKLVKSDLIEGNMQFTNMENAQQFLKSADLILGCDGAFSNVRRQMLKTPGFNYSQEYIEHGYLELSIPAKDDQFQMAENYLHIWPRDVFMMIALPNQDKSFTVTLFMPFKLFESIRNEIDLIKFFHKNYPDALLLMGEKRLIKEFFQTKPQHLISIKCNPYNIGSKAVLIGDAAHAMVPFYGQGMNCGLEDCRLLSNALSEHGNIGEALQKYSDSRWKDAHAICDLAMYNYVEMRDLTKSFSFRIRKYLDNLLFSIFPNHWIPLYNSVSFTDMPYNECTDNRKWQDMILKYILIGFLIAFTAMIYNVILY